VRASTESYLSATGRRVVAGDSAIVAAEARSTEGIRMPIQPRVCPAQVSLTQDEYQRLEALPDPAHQMRRDLQCEFEADHTDPHCALGQQDGDDAWWLRWNDTGTLRELLTHPACPAEAVPADDSQPCFLIEGHGGVHSFQLH
jgi:hypothetical protein